MLIPSSKILEAKEKLGEQAAIIIAKELDIQNFNEEHLKGCCPWHKEETPSLVWSREFNFFKCFGCGKKYDILDLYLEKDELTFLESVEKLFKVVEFEYKFTEKGVKTKKDYRYPHQEDKENIDKIVEFWKDRKISKETLEYVGVGQDHYGNSVFHYYDTNDVLLTVYYRISRKIKKGENLTKFWAQKDSDTTPLLLGMNKIDPLQPLVITEGQSDYLAVIEAGYKNVVSVPFGANNFSWIDENWDFLEQFQKIIVWSDNDDAGLKMRKEVCSRLGTWRTYFIDLPKEIEINENKYKVKDINEVLFYCGKECVMDHILNKAQEVPVQNIRSLNEFDDFDIETTNGLYSGIKDLDNIIYKFVYGSVVLLTGKRGGGKSTLLNQIFICNALDQGESVFIYSGEMSGPILKNWVETTMIGRENIEVKEGFIRKFSKDKLAEMRNWYKNRIFAYDSMDNNIDTILDRAILLTRRFGVKIWILDNLLTLDIGIANEGNKLQKETDFINKLVAVAKTYGVLVVLCAHPRKAANGVDLNRRLTVDDIAGSGSLGNLVQYILSTHRYSKKEKEGEKAKSGGFVKGKEPVKFDVALDVLKNRYTGKVDDVDLYFDYVSYRFYKFAHEIWRRFKWNKDNSPLNQNDPNKHSVEPDWMDD